MRKLFVVAFLSIFPWHLRRYLLNFIFNYSIDRNAYISRLSLIAPVKLQMKRGAKIEAFSVAIHLNKLSLGEDATIGRSNWISGFPKNVKGHFDLFPDRSPDLIIGDHSAITKRHIIDCTESVHIGSFTTIAGYGSQLLTHSIDYVESIQRCAPITIGDYCLVGTRCIFLPGCSLPNCSVLGAGAIANKRFTEGFALYAGSPARRIKNIDWKSKYFFRDKGYID